MLHHNICLRAAWIPAPSNYYKPQYFSRNGIAASDFISENLTHCINRGTHEKRPVLTQAKAT